MATPSLEDVLERFHTASGPDDWKIRRECVAALETLFLSESPERLLQLFKETTRVDYQLCIALARALGNHKDARALPTLLALLGLSEHRQDFIAASVVMDALQEALSLKLKHESIDTLLTHYDNTQGIAQQAIATELQEARYKQESIDTLLTRYDDTQGIERRAIIAALKHIFSEESIERLLQRFAEREPETGFKVVSSVHVAIAEALNSKFANESRDALLGYLTQLPDSDEAWRIKHEILQALATHFQQESVDALLQRFDQAHGPHSRELQQTIVKVLAIKADPAAVQPLIERLPLLRDEGNFYDQMGLIDTLGKLKDADAIPALQQWFEHRDEYFTLHDKERETRVLLQRIIAALGTIGDPTALAFVIAHASLLSRHDWSLGRQTLQNTVRILRANRTTSL